MPVELPEATRIAASSIAGRGTFVVGTLPAGAVVARFPAPPAGQDALGPLNHSCDPNLVWDGVELTTARDLADGEELTLDYVTALGEPGLLFFCHCETYRCRQAIEGTDWRIPQLQQRYAGRWHPAVQRLIDDG